MRTEIYLHSLDSLDYYFDNAILQTAGQPVCAGPRLFLPALQSHTERVSPFVSIHFAAAPNLYIRHTEISGDGTMEISPISSTLDKQEATFRLAPGLANPEAISLESVNMPGYYLRSAPSGGDLTLQSFSDTQNYRDGATFWVQESHNSAISFRSYVVPNGYIRVGPGHTGLVVQNWYDSGDTTFTQDIMFRIVGPLWIP
jgi:hypothetical protein